MCVCFCDQSMIHTDWPALRFHRWKVLPGGTNKRVTLLTLEREEDRMRAAPT